MPGASLAAGRARRAFEKLRPGSKAGQFGRAFGALERMYQTQYALFSRGALRRLLVEPDAGAGWGIDDERLSALAGEIASLPASAPATVLESELFLGDRLLRDMDSVSMAHSLEVRVPLVDFGAGRRPRRG